MTSALSVTELGYIRRDGQHSRLYLAIHNPATVFAARVNQAFPDSASKDKVVEITYDSITTGAYTDIIAGMTCYVGSTPGAYDLGMVRMRAAADASKVYLGENSDVKWADDAYLTVVDEFGLWAKYPRLLANGSVYMDYDVAYSNQHSAFKPVVVMGTDAVLWLTGASVAIAMDASNSWCFSSGSPTYQWACAGGSVSGATTATPTITFTAPGVFRVSCTVTVGGVPSTGYRHVFVYNDANPPVVGGQNSGFTLSAPPTVDMERGGWEFDVTLFGNSANISTVREGAKVILFSRDWYGSTEDYIGAQPGRGNIKASGWIAGETLVLNPVEGAASFSVKGPHHWLDRLASFIDGIESGPATPAAWTSMQALTVDKAVWHLLEWRSTVTAVLDFYRSGDTHQAKALQTAQGGLLGQIRANSEPVFAQPRFDRYGRLWLLVEQQVLATADRASIPTVMTLTKQDWSTIHVNRQTTSREARIELSGVYYADGESPRALFSLSGGHVFKRHGDAVTVERLLLASQDEANTRSGLLLGWHNRKYEFEIKGAGNNGMIDIAPQQYLGLTIAAGDTPRGVTFSGRMVPRRVTMQFDATVGFISYDVVGEEESVAENSVDGDVPPASLNVDWDNSIPSDFSLPSLPNMDIVLPSPSTPPTSTVPPKEIIIHSSNFGVMYTKNSGANWYFMNAGLNAGDYPYIQNLVVTPSKAAWMLVKSPTGDYLYRAQALGGTWTLITTGVILGGNLLGVGVNPNVDEQIAVVGGYTDIFSGLCYLYFFTGSSMTQGATSFFPYWGRVVSVINSDGDWYVLYPQRTSVFSVPPYIAQFSSAGTLIASGSIEVAGDSVGGEPVYAVPAGNKFFKWTFIPAAYRIIDSSLIVSGYTVIHPNVNPQGVAFSPTGMFGMGAGNPSPITPYKTSDGGVTWTSAAAIIPVGQAYWENCGDDFRWLWAGGNVVRFSADFGASYVGIEGDMITTAPLISIRGIRMVSL